MAISVAWGGGGTKDIRNINRIKKDKKNEDIRRSLKILYYEGKKRNVDKTVGILQDQGHIFW